MYCNNNITIIMLRPSVGEKTAIAVIIFRLVNTQTATGHHDCSTAVIRFVDPNVTAVITTTTVI